ncbi:unnamed protein product [Gongylonema pulchrum]|uniref:Uncharacterized protein n=1 Tax=Gongylonema pulchrum TaxID=637853 RepID=A0A183DP33_9BILA|nr:unnamed protein product [Gongylonema pulchrum]
MLFACSGSSSVINQRIVVIGQEEFPVRPGSSIGDHRGSLQQSGRNSRGSASCPETFRTYADSPARDTPHFRSRSNSRSGSRTEILRPGQWTAVTPQVKLRALTPSEQHEVFEAQKREGLLHKASEQGECL